MRIYVVPDGGYGWVVVCASFVAHILQFSVVWTVGVFYVIFLDHFGESRTLLALIVSLNTGSFYLIGPVAGLLTDRYGAKLITMIGGLIGSLGLVLTSFAVNAYQLLVTFGLVTGVGIGLAYVPCVSIVGTYFDKKRPVAIGVMVSGLGVGTCIAPPIINSLVTYYGWRGCLLILGGFCANIIVCGALYRPLKFTTYIESQKHKTKKKDTQLDDHTDCMALSKLILSNTSYLLLGVNNILQTFGFAVVYVHLAAYAMTIGISVTQGAMLFSALGVANTIGRIVYGVIAYTTRIDHVLLYGFALATTGLVTMACPIIHSYVGLLCSSVAFGLLSAGYGTLLAQNVIIFLSPELLSIGYGYIMVADAIGTLLGGPMAGLLFETTQVYSTSFFLGGGATFLSGMIMIPAYFKRSATKALFIDSIENVEC